MFEYDCATASPRGQTSMQTVDERPAWDLSPAIDLLKALSFSEQRVEASSLLIATRKPRHPSSPLELSQPEDEELSLGNFSKIWDFLSLYQDNTENKVGRKSLEDDVERVTKEVRWRDEISGADLEDNVDTEQFISAASLRTRERAARRARAKARADKGHVRQATARGVGPGNSTDDDTDLDLDRLHRSPDRRAVIQDILRRPSRGFSDLPSPPTSPSPPKESSRVLQKEWPISNPFQWSATPSQSSVLQDQLAPRDHLAPEERKAKLITQLTRSFPKDSKYLKNKGLVYPEFIPLNTSESGIHVFVDISNIMIGFHDCLKRYRDIPISTRIRRVPMSFHNFSLVLERGRPAAKRVLVGSDKFPTIQQAKEIGYETNILERVHKVKELTPRQRRLHNGGGVSGVSSGSETNTPQRPEKWVEQAVDEILHLKILESLIDTEDPSTMILATGDAAEAEYSGGFMRMVERALAKGWMVELVSFKLNTSGAYQDKNFRARWGSMFKWLPLDEFVEDLVDDQDG